MAAPNPPEELAELLWGVDPAWLPLMDLAALARAAVGPAAAGATPPPRLVLDAFRFGAPADVAVVILGQDPYPTPGAAQGLCFSAPQPPLPDTLRRVFACLARSGLAHAAPPPRPPAKKRGATRAAAAAACAGAAVSGDLRPWAVQGVLMLNAALTTRAGTRGALAPAWRPFIDGLLGRLCALHAGRPLHFLLWGADARARAALVRRHGHVAHEWTHPSPTADNRVPVAARFRECPHFTDVNAALVAAGRRPVVWDNTARVVAFSDGACIRNGRLDARAGFAAVVAGGQFAGVVVRGEVRPTEYELRAAGGADAADWRLCHVAGGAQPATPSNNRGELMGIIYCILVCLRGCAVGPVEIVSDSAVAIKTLTEWLPSRLAKNTERELKNFDLVWVAWQLLGALRAQAASVTFTHVHSHRAAPPADAPTREKVLWAGNDTADKHAGAPLAGAATFDVEVIGGPPVVAALATRA
jgi:uracil-DNA glycosylase